MMTEDKAKAAGKPSLLGRYFQQGWLSKKYYIADGYRQLYSAEDRLLAGTMLYADFLKWGEGTAAGARLRNAESRRRQRLGRLADRHRGGKFPPGAEKGVGAVCAGAV